MIERNEESQSFPSGGWDGMGWGLTSEQQLLNTSCRLPTECKWLRSYREKCMRWLVEKFPNVQPNYCTLSSVLSCVRMNNTYERYIYGYMPYMYPNMSLRLTLWRPSLILNSSIYPMYTSWERNPNRDYGARADIVDKIQKKLGGPPSWKVFTITAIGNNETGEIVVVKRFT